MAIKLRHRDNFLWPRFGLAFVAGLMILGCFQSANMLASAYDLPDGKVSEWVVARAENWHGWMQTIGLADVSDSLAIVSADLHSQPVVGDIEEGF